VEPERRDEFEQASNATRAAWAWRRYVTAAQAVPGRTIEIRYEQLAADPEGVGGRVAESLGADPEQLTTAFARVHGRSLGRWRSDLGADELDDVEREAGALLHELGYT
jgi:LPS sulfotransferase NodH